MRITSSSTCLAVLVPVLAAGADSSIPHLRRQGAATQLVVDGRPFLVRGGELGNSTASNASYLEPFWPRFAELNMNTVLVPVYWDLSEPEEGRFDFSLVDQVIAQARRNRMRLVLLWFASWKNSMSCYAPAWVKRDPRRFPRATDLDGTRQEIFSPFSAENRDADARAFAALLRHLRDADGTRVVVMVQVENEIGMIPTARDHSAEADRAFASAVPGDLMASLATQQDPLAPELRQTWREAGRRSSGTWPEVFGEGPAGEEIFMAWHFARYTEAVAAAGKKEYPLPLFVNAALIRPGHRPGQYPSAGPLPHLLDVWRAAAPSIDFLAPDIYFQNFTEWARRYKRSGNPLFVPEALRSPEASVNALYAFGAHDAMGFSPFGIESIGEAAGRHLAASYALVAQLEPLILERQGREQMAGLLSEGPEQRQPLQVRLGGWVLAATFERGPPASLADGVVVSTGAPAGTPPPSGGLVLALAPDEFVIAGTALPLLVPSAPTTKAVKMLRTRRNGMFRRASLTSAAVLTLMGGRPAAGPSAASPGSGVALAPARMARLGSVDERYQSYNVEMVEVTGGRFWKPYAAGSAGAREEKKEAPPQQGTPAGLPPDLFEQRAPIDLRNPRLRKLAAALGPAYVRVSGTWANSTYFPESDDAPQAPPPGFNGVVTRPQWKGVVDFARAVDAEIMTSMATSAGTRDAGGVWTPVQARRVLDYTRSVGGRVGAAEFMNEPNFAEVGGAPAGYDASAYGRDFKAFLAFVKQAAPDLLILGPGSVGESASGDLGSGRMRMLKTRDLLAAGGPGVDGFSYHHYGTISRRCTGPGVPTTSPEEALSEGWLSRPDASLAFYKSLRDEFEPGKPLWLTETADAACGGNPWASSFLDTFRYLDQLGRLARQDVRVVAHNTLVASDYGMIEEHDLTPKPKYWGALLWRRLMGATVLDPGVPLRAGLHAYAHCLKGRSGGVALLLLNTDKAAPQTVTVPAPAERYTLSSAEHLSRRVDLNGTELKLGADDALPRLAGARVSAGSLTLAPATITFVAVPGAGNPSCR